MCGICGAFAFSSKVVGVDVDNLIATSDHLRLRGPDGHGMWISPDYRVGLAHRRLAILDTSDAGAQPMRDAGNGNVIVYNGEIYNYPELREQLTRAGTRFRSQTDTEVLLHLYAEHGTDMLRFLRGMYSFAIWDVERYQLFLARDPYGIKPLYFTTDGMTFQFASTVRSLISGTKMSVTHDPAGQVGFFLYGSVPEPYTLFNEVSALPAGTHMIVRRTGIQSSSANSLIQDSFDSTSRFNSNSDPAAIVESIADAVKESIKAHLLADVPVGAFLSGGLDSSMVTGIAAESLPSLHALTLGFDDFIGLPSDETVAAEAYAKALHIPYSCRWVSANDFVAERSAFMQAMDQPTIDGLNTWHVAKFAAQSGLKVVLSGVGGDEIFRSYPSFSTIPSILRFGEMLKYVNKFGQSVRFITYPLAKRFGKPKLAGLLEYSNSFERAYLLAKGLFMPWELYDVLDPDLIESGLTKLNNFTCSIKVNSQHDLLTRISIAESTCYLKNQLLRDIDWIGMSHSLEIRAPLVDVILLRAAAQAFLASPNIKKSAIASAVIPGLSPDAIARKKQGFAIPLSRWIPHDRRLGSEMRSWAVYVHNNYIAQI
jgi:asparagine synthase (glutamine-hydrolysing)